MSTRRAICKRCHRLKVVDRTGYCISTCSGELRAAERPRRTGHAVAETTPGGPMFFLPEIEDPESPPRSIF